MPDRITITPHIAPCQPEKCLKTYLANVIENDPDVFRSDQSDLYLIKEMLINAEYPRVQGYASKPAGEPAGPTENARFLTS